MYKLLNYILNKKKEYLYFFKTTPLKNYEIFQYLQYLLCLFCIWIYCDTVQQINIKEQITCTTHKPNHICFCFPCNKMHHIKAKVNVVYDWFLHSLLSCFDLQSPIFPFWDVLHFLLFSESEHWWICWLYTIKGEEMYFLFSYLFL